MAIFAATKYPRREATQQISPRGWNTSPNQPPSDVLSVHKEERFCLAPSGPIRENQMIYVSTVIPITYDYLCKERMALHMHSTKQN